MQAKIDKNYKTEIEVASHQRMTVDMDIVQKKKRNINLCINISFIFFFSFDIDDNFIQVYIQAYFSTQNDCNSRKTKLYALLFSTVTAQSALNTI